MNHAGEAVATDEKPVHPFFSAPKAVTIPHNGQVGGPITPDPSCSPASDRMIDMSEQHAANTAHDPSHRPKRQKVDNGNSFIVRPVAGSDQQQSMPTPANAPDFAGLGDHAATTPTTSIPTFETGTKKVLMLNPKSGTIGSPPKPKALLPVEPPAQKKRGRSKKFMIVGIRYGKQDLMKRQQLGKKIEQIRSGSLRICERVELVAPPPGEVPFPKKASATTKKASAKPTSRNKSTHPFFMSKPMLNAPNEVSTTNTSSPPQQKRHSIFTSTPCSPKRPRQPPPQFNRPALGGSSGILKFPGAQHPAFPWQDIAHVRGHDSMSTTTTQTHVCVGSSPMSSRKAKGYRTTIAKDESIMTHSLSQLNIGQLVSEAKENNGQAFKPPPSLLRVPTRHFESGKKLQARVSEQLQTWPNKNQKPHSALRRNFERIATESSAFDRSTCESASWAAKYAPVSADTVLQSGQEAYLLRDWLLALKVQSVDTGSSENALAKSKEAQSKKKRRRNKLDDFIVDDDDEFSSLAAESNDEADWLPESGRGEVKKTITRSVIAGPTLSNAILLSGPHGCGKTAAVYGVAKELDFEIFEINPGSRRSGKDILERVGDMTRNHLVHHHRAEEAPVLPEVEDEVARDLKSGKQGTMMNFFKSKPGQATKPEKVHAASIAKKTPQTTQKQPEIRKGGRSQKQSLILLEEVDVLYEEDKQFWATVISMMAQSRRPFVMTCSEESLVQFATLNLHGILRFTPPPVDYAADLLLLIAASEGHLLQRAAVEALYETRRRDLRASIMELNYWCQIGVGDPQGGFNWFFPRWPKGVDIDENGDTIRVISDGTYQRGMGWLSREASNSSSLAYPAAEQAHLDVWNEWGLDMTGMDDKFSSWARIPPHSPSTDELLANLEAADNYLTALSDADLCSSNAFGCINNISLDTTLPPLPSKLRDDSVLGRPFLEVHPLASHLTQSADTYIALAHLANSLLPQSDSAMDIASPDATETQTLEAIQNSFINPKPKAVSRVDFASAFDPLAVSEKTMAAGFLDPSVFDRTMRLITLDVAPYARSIVAYDERLRQERLMRSNILSEGGKLKKKMRTTRAAMSALEGGARGTTRRERYFQIDVNAHMVRKTAGDGWEKAVWDCLARETGGDGRDSVMSASQQTGGSSTAGSPAFSGLEGGDVLKGHGGRRSRSREESVDELA